MSRRGVLFLPFLVLVFMSIPVIHATYENFDYWTEVSDDDSDLVPYGTELYYEFDIIQTNYIYNDYGVGFFNDFNITFSFNITARNTAHNELGYFILANTLGDGYDIINSGEDYLLVRWRYRASTNALDFIRISQSNGTQTSSGTVPLSLNTNYWVQMNKTGQTFGVYLYSDQALSNLLNYTVQTLAEDEVFRYLIIGGHDVNFGTASEEMKGWVKELDLHGISTNYVYADILTDLSFWYRYTYSSNITANHKFEVSSTPDFSNIISTDWNNNTNNPELYAPASNLLPNKTHYYRVKLFNSSTGVLIYTSPTQNFTTPLTYTMMDGLYFDSDQFYDAVDANDDFAIRDVQYVSSGNKVYINRPENNPKHIHLWYFNLDNPRLVDTGVIYNNSLDGGDDKRAGVVMAYNGSIYIIIQHTQESDGDGTGCHLYYGPDLENLTYYGKIIGVSSGNKRIEQAYYNHTDNKWYFYYGTGETNGDWDTIWLITSEDFVLDETPIRLYSEGDWAVGSWADSYVYPPKPLIWVDIGGPNQRAIGGTSGCADVAQPYDFSWDLLFTNTSKVNYTDYYSNTTDPTGISKDWFATGGKFDMGLTNPTGLRMWWDDENRIWCFQTEYDGQDYAGANPADVWFGQLHGFWLGEKIGVLKGSFPQNQYYDLPTRAEFDGILDARIYAEDYDINVTITEYDNVGPTYAVIDVESPSGNNLIFDLDDLNNVTAYLHVEEITGGYRYTIDNNSSNKLATLTATDDDYLFSVTTGEQAFQKSVSLISPDNVNLKYLPITFTYTPSTDEAISSAELWMNISGVWQQIAVDTTVTNGSSNSFHYNLTEGGKYVWNVRVNDTVESFWATSNASFTLLYDYIDEFGVVAGNPLDVNVVATYALDGAYCTVQEVTGSPGFDIRCNETELYGEVTRIDIMLYAWYDGGPQKTGLIQVYNYTSGSWHTVFDIGTTTGFNWYNITLVEDRSQALDFIPSSGPNKGILMKRLVHPDPGNKNNYFHVDFIALRIYFSTDNVALESPLDDAVKSTHTIYFKYTPYVYGSTTILGAELWTNTTGTWGKTASNSTALVNATTSTIQHTFSQDGTYLWNIRLLTDKGNITHTSNYTLTITTNTAPSPVSMEFTNLVDGVFFVSGIETVFELKTVCQDTQGGSDIQHQYISLQWGDSNVWFNATLAPNSYVITSGEDLMKIHYVEGTNNGQNQTLRVGLSSDNPPIDELNGYLKAEDISNATSTILSAPKLAMVLIYDSDGGGGGGGGGAVIIEPEEPVTPGITPTPKEEAEQEYLIEMRNPLDESEIIRILPIPWDWNVRQKLFVAYVLYGFFVVLILTIIKRVNIFLRKRRRENYGLPVFS